MSHIVRCTCVLCFSSYWMVLWISFLHLVLQNFHLRLAHLHIICQKSGHNPLHKICQKFGHNPLHKICIPSFCCISRSKGKTQSWCWLAIKRHAWSWPLQPRSGAQIVVHDSRLIEDLYPPPESPTHQIANCKSYWSWFEISNSLNLMKHFRI